MFQSAVRFALALVVTFVLLTYMWVSAASAQTTGSPRCTLLPSGVIACEGSTLPDAPRGTVKHRPAASAQHRAAAALAASRGRVGSTVIIARLGR